ncbi:MAG: quinolinate synthase NadA [Candidatus Diapherotrites archaeon]
MFSGKETGKEAERLYSSLSFLGNSLDYCRDIAPITLQINALKKEKKAVILGHNYMKAEILAGVADFIGDSLALAKKAKETNAGIIVFCGVHFMAETAKMLSPNKKVLLPDLDAGCSLAESITAEDVKKLKQKHPKIPVITYINSSAEVKAESDAICTSANALKVIESFPEDKIIFLPDKFMGANLQKQTKKKLILWNGKCIAHEGFSAGQLKNYKKKFSGIKIMSHLECKPEVIALSDFAGGTSGMVKYAEESIAKQFLVVTECGMSDVLKMKFPEKEFINPCSICPYMKKISLENTLKVLQEESNEIFVEKEISEKAEKALKRMLKVK